MLDIVQLLWGGGALGTTYNSSYLSYNIIVSSVGSTVCLYSLFYVFEKNSIKIHDIFGKKKYRLFKGIIIKQG